MNYNDIRKEKKSIKIGNLYIGGNNSIKIQSMLNTDPHDYEKSLLQFNELITAGCDIIRISIIDDESLIVLNKLKNSNPNVPIVSDIQFDYRLAIKSIDYGADKVRVNPGNIGDFDNYKKIVEKCKINDIPIRIGINSGSLEKELLQKYGAPTPEALAESALNNVKLVESLNYDKLVISIKSSSPYKTFLANKLFSEQTHYPIHIGVTEAGFGKNALLKSSAALSSLLLNGIGDTIRVSLSENPVNEVYAAESLLNSLEIYKKPTFNLISCPTCGRTKIDLISIVNQLNNRLNNEIVFKRNIKIAVMGCVVNGPGEASEADIGIAGGNKCGVIFAHGKILKKVDENQIIDELINHIKVINDEE